MSALYKSVFHRLAFCKNALFMVKVRFVQVHELQDFVLRVQSMDTWAKKKKNKEEEKALLFKLADFQDT